MAKRICALIGATLMLIVLVFNTFAFAQALPSEDSTLQENLLLVPRRTISRVLTSVDGSTAVVSDYSMLFDTNPLYKREFNLGSLTTQYINGTQGNWQGADKMTHYSIMYQHSYWAQENMHLYNAYLTRERPNNSGATYVTQYDFESFHIRSGVDDFAWCIRKNTDIADYVAIRLEFVTYNESDGYSIGTAQKNFFFGERGYISISDIYDFAVENGAYSYYDGGVLFRSMSVVNVTPDSCLLLCESDLSVGNSVTQYLVFPLLKPNSDNFPDFLSWLADTVGGFFGTIIFAFNGVEVTIGTLILIPLSCSLLVIFLKKFAGG